MIYYLNCQCQKYKKKTALNNTHNKWQMIQSAIRTHWFKFKIEIIEIGNGLLTEFFILSIDNSRTGLDTSKNQCSAPAVSVAVLDSEKKSDQIYL